MRFLYVILLFFLLSCSTNKVRLNDWQPTQDLRGKIKSMTVNTKMYNPSFNDSTTNEVISKIYFDDKNRTLKLIEDYSNFIGETEFLYKKNLLVSRITKINNRVEKEVFEYDKHDNLVQYKQFENDTLYLSNISIYDSHGNPIKKMTFFPNNRSHNFTEKYKYDYKNKYVFIQTLKEINESSNDRYLKIQFNKKGLMIRTETITSSKKGYVNFGNIREYDKKGNIIKQYSLDNEGKIKTVAYYKYTFDFKGNILVKEIFLGNKLIEKTTYDIVYKN